MAIKQKKKNNYGERVYRKDVGLAVFASISISLVVGAAIALLIWNPFNWKSTVEEFHNPDYVAPTEPTDEGGEEETPTDVSKTYSVLPTVLTASDGFDAVNNLTLHLTIEEKPVTFRIGTTSEGTVQVGDPIDPQYLVMIEDDVDPYQLGVGVTATEGGLKFTAIELYSSETQKVVATTSTGTSEEGMYYVVYTDLPTQFTLHHVVLTYELAEII